MRLLLTAFDAFGGESVNPAQQALERIPDVLGSHQIDRCVIPTVFGKAGDVLEQAMNAASYDAVLCVGQAGGRAGLTFERIAINCEDAGGADNAGQIPVDRPVVPDGPAAYFATLPIKAMVEAVRAGGYTASVSNSAGTFVCNHLLYRLMHRLANHPETLGGFVHVPYLPEQLRGRELPSMTAQEIASALCLALEVLK